MLLTVTTTFSPATDLGYLLHKNPARAQTFSQAFGTAHVFYPEATVDRCTAALFVDIDPIGLVRGRGRGQGEAGLLAQYVNDRPYAASSLLSVAIADVFRSALNGRCAERPDLVERPIPLEFRLPAVPARGGAQLLESLFAPLGYLVETERLPLDSAFPEWGDSPYCSLCLKGTLPLHLGLAHLYVLLPVLDDAKHYWVGEGEVEKLLRHGEAWLQSHPARDLIVRRYLKYQRSLESLAIERLTEIDESAQEDEEETEGDAREARRGDSAEQALERGIRLNDLRLEAVAAAVEAVGASSAVDLGCGEGKLLKRLLENRRLERITGLDVSMKALTIARDRLRFDRLPKIDQERLSFLHGGLTYRDTRIAGYDVATAVEVIEHLDSGRLSAFERVLFECAHARNIIVTTPNREYNAKFITLAHGRLRHPDHRFEWTRAEFAEWTARIGTRFGYRVRIESIGEPDPALGAPTQMALFEQT